MSIYNKPQMLRLLEFSLMLCLVSISGEGWVEELPPKTQNDFVGTSFFLEISPMVSSPFYDFFEARVCNQGIFKILFYVLLASYVEIIL